MELYPHNNGGNPIIVFHVWSFFSKHIINSYNQQDIKISLQNENGRSAFELLNSTKHPVLADRNKNIKDILSREITTAIKLLRRFFFHFVESRGNMSKDSSNNKLTMLAKNTLRHVGRGGGRW